MPALNRPASTLHIKAAGKSIKASSPLSCTVVSKGSVLLLGVEVVHFPMS
jgi:hypothetical protein